MNILSQVSQRIFLLIFLAGALGAHLFVVPALNVIEDESAYMQDAAQTTRSFLPFRDFGGTKGPLYLAVLHEWQKLFSPSVEVSRMFSVVFHLFSVVIFYGLSKRLLSKPWAWMSATALWSLSPVVVSLTSNVTHIPFELTIIFASMWLLTWSKSKPWHLALAGVLFFAALLSRATAVAFGPVFLYFLISGQMKWKRFLSFSGGFLLVFLLSLLVIYPLYGWPKTAFFFNADALLIANDQRAAYAQQEQLIPPIKALYNALQPAWIDGFALMGLAVCSIPLFISRKLWIPGFFVAGLLLLFVATQGEVISFTSTDHIVLQRAVIRGLLLMTFMVAMFIEICSPVESDTTSRKNLLVVAVCWLGAFFIFYKGWGRSPTPFYPLESLPMMALLGGFVVGRWQEIFVMKAKRDSWVFISLVMLVAIDVCLSLKMIPSFQYRGTMEMGPVREMSAIISQKVPKNEVLFTAQPVFAYATNRALLGGYTHPGWYLSERAGYLPTSIRRVFLPDMPELTRQVNTSVNWILVDWRTTDVYFNEGAEETKSLRAILATKFHEVARVENPASRDIVLYERNTHVQP